MNAQNCITRSQAFATNSEVLLVAGANVRTLMQYPVQDSPISKLASINQ